MILARKDLNQIIVDLMPQEFVPDTYDCLWLVEEFFRRIGINVYDKGWHTVDTPGPLDVAYISRHNGLAHVGIMMDSERMLHTIPGAGVSYCVRENKYRTCPVVYYRRYDQIEITE